MGNSKSSSTRGTTPPTSPKNTSGNDSSFDNNNKKALSPRRRDSRTSTIPSLASNASSPPQTQPVLPLATDLVGGGAPDFRVLHGLKRAMGTSDDKTRVLMIGLEGAGKKSLLTRISNGTRELHDMGTQKFKVGSLQVFGLHFTMWDVGADKFVDDYWLKLYAERVSCVCFVVDASSAKPLLDEARTQLFKFLELDMFGKKPLLILGTKGDVPSALSLAKLSEALELHEIPANRKYKAFRTGGEAVNLAAGLEWLIRWCSLDGTFYGGDPKFLEGNNSMASTSSGTEWGDDTSRVVVNIAASVEDDSSENSAASNHAAAAGGNGGPKAIQSRGSFVLTRATEQQRVGSGGDFPRLNDLSSASALFPPPRFIPATDAQLGNEPLAADQGYFDLPRGGYLVVTKSAGLIQFGIPPETIKDTLMAGMPVPENFVILGEMFDRRLGLSKAEFEFPLYYSYYQKCKRVNVITTAALEERIRRALKETLLGPGKDCNVQDDYPPGTPADALPDFEAEGECLDPARKKTTLDDVVRFTRFELAAGATIGDVRISPVPDPSPRKGVGAGGPKIRYEVKENGRVLAYVPSHVRLKGPEYGITGIGGGGGEGVIPHTPVVHTAKSTIQLHDMERRAYQDEEVKHLAHSPAAVTNDSQRMSQSGEGEVIRRRELSFNDDTLSRNFTPARGTSARITVGGSHVERYAGPQHSLPMFAPFAVPRFGITMMGASHGFDATGRTTGFVLWMNRRGIMVDPPPDSNQILEVMGVPPRAIEAVFLTHTHADHDAGTFQKILRTKLIRLYATRTVERSFVRKYSAITGFDEKFVRSLFEFHPVRCNEAFPLHDGFLKFFYTLHTIPCVGLEAHFNGHSICYSADTRYDPEMILGLAQAGKIGRRRAEQLANFNFDHTVVLHELGVPPIHTPRAALEKAADDPKHVRKGEPLRARLFIVHAGRGDGDGLGTQCMDWDTIRVSGAEDVSNQKKEIISLLSNVSWLEFVGEKKLEQLAAKCTVHHFERGADVVEFKEGVPPERLYVVMAGVASEQSGRGGGEQNGLDPHERPTLYPIGASFGEIGLLRHLDKMTAPSKAIPAPSSKEKQTPGRKTVQAAQLKDFPQRFIVADSTLYVCEIKNKDIISILSKSVLSEVRDKLKRFTGYPEDARWRCISRNPPLMHLLEQQLAVRDLIASMMEEVEVFPKGHVFQDGRSGGSPEGAYVINEGVIRVTLMTTGVLSYRGGDQTANAQVFEPYDLGRGAVVGDINALLKGQRSAFRFMAMRETEAFFIPREALIGVLDDFPGLKFGLLDRVHVGYAIPKALTTTGESFASHLPQSADVEPSHLGA